MTFSADQNRDQYRGLPPEQSHGEGDGNQEHQPARDDEEAHPVLDEAAVAADSQKDKSEGGHAPAGEGRRIKFQAFGRIHQHQYADTDLTPATVPTANRRAAYPNPFNPAINLVFEIDHQRDIKMTIFDVRGRAVRTLAEGNWAAGTHTLKWNGTDTTGKQVAAGVYFARLQSDGWVSDRKLVMVK